MYSTLSTLTKNRFVRIIGWLTTLFPAFVLTMSGTVKILVGTHVIAAMPENGNKIGWDVSLLLPLGIVELTSLLLYLVPRTSFIGAILCTAWMGGAIAAHVRIHEPFIPQLVIGILLWVGFVIRNPLALTLLFGDTGTTSR